MAASPRRATEDAIRLLDGRHSGLEPLKHLVASIRTPPRAVSVGGARSVEDGLIVLPEPLEETQRLPFVAIN